MAPPTRPQASSARDADIGGSVRIPRPSECFPTAMELFRQQHQHTGTGLQTPMAQPPPPGPALPPVMAQIPSGLHSPSATACREHQRWTRRSQRTPHQPNGVSVMHPSHSSFTQRLKQKFQRMALRHTMDATSGTPPPTHPTVAQEFNDHMRTALLCALARGMQIPVNDLARSPALHTLLQPYMQWFQQTPSWMQFGGLLLAKKCAQVCAQRSGGEAGGVWPPSGTEISAAPSDTGHWITASMTADESIASATIPYLGHEENKIHSETAEDLTPLPPSDDATDFEFSFREPPVAETSDPTTPEEIDTAVVDDLEAPTDLPLAPMAALKPVRSAKPKAPRTAKPKPSKTETDTVVSPPEHAETAQPSQSATKTSKRPRTSTPSDLPKPPKKKPTPKSSLPTTDSESPLETASGPPL